MLLPPEADLFALGLAGVGLFGTLAYMIRGGRLLWVVISGAVFTLGFVALFIVTVTMTCKVVKVTGASELHAERALQLGSCSADSLIVNETDKPLTLRTAVYSMTSVGGSAPPPDRRIAPHTTAPVDAFVDHLGPDDPLPTEVSSSGSSTTQYWLSW